MQIPMSIINNEKVVFRIDYFIMSSADYSLLSYLPNQPGISFEDILFSLFFRTLAYIPSILTAIVSELRRSPYSAKLTYCENFTLFSYYLKIPYNSSIAHKHLQIKGCKLPIVVVCHWPNARHPRKLLTHPPPPQLGRQEGKINEGFLS